MIPQLFRPDRPTDIRLRSSVARRAWRFLRPYTGLLAGLCGILAAAATLGALPPFLLGRVVDSAVARSDVNALLNLCLLSALFYVLSAVATVLGGLLATAMGTRLIRDLRMQLFERIQRLPVDFFVHARGGSIQSRLNNDVLNVQQFFTGHMFTGAVSFVAADGLAVIIFSTAMLIIDWRVAILCLGVMPLFLLPVRLANRPVSELTKEQLTLYAEMNAFSAERLSLAGATQVWLFGSFASVVREYGARTDALRRNNVRVNALAVSFGSILTLMGSITVVLVLLLGGRLAISGSTSVGELLALVVLSQRLYAPIVNLSGARLSLSTALVSFERVFEVLDADDRRPPTAQPLEPTSARGILEVSDVSFAYSSKPFVASLERPASTRCGHSALALEGISFRAERGQRIAVVGTTGAGKSTLALVVAGLLSPRSGMVLVDGDDMSRMTDCERARKVSVVTQDSHFFNQTLRENLLMARPSATRSDLDEACGLARLSDVIAALPHGYETFVGEGGHRLSGGERQRLALARVLLRDPEVLVLDEATAHLDSRTEWLIQSAMGAALKGRTAVVIAHRLSTVRDATEILVMEGGRIVERGTHASLYANDDGVYRAMCEAQLVT